MRPTEVDALRADPAKARDQLSWEPKVTFPELVRIMVDGDMEAAGLQPVGEGNRILRARFSDWHRWRISVSAAVRSLEGDAVEKRSA